MKKKLLALVCTMCVVFGVCLTVPSSRSAALYNDAKYDAYKNMGTPSEGERYRYVVPNLYRQDASYTNVKTFPLVVSGSVEYFPLDIFALYSYLEVVYGKLSYGFYINNTKNNHYVAFDLGTGTTTTHDSQSVDIQAKLFYRTYYVPAKDVCDILGMNFETYDDPENGIRAARISDDKAKYTLSELVTMYSPVKIETPEPEPEPPTEPNPPVIEQPITPSQPSSEPENPKPVELQPDPYASVANRYLYLTFENCPDAHTQTVLNLLQQYGVKAIFFVDKDKILEYPDTVRRMIADGHTVGLYVSAASGQADMPVLSNEQIAQRLSEAGDALQLVTKSRTRFVRVASGLSQELTQNGFAAYIGERGYVLYDWSIDARDASGRAAAAFEQLRDDIVGGNTRVARTLYVRFGSYNATAGVLERLLAFCAQYPRFQFMPSDEFCDPPVFVSA